MASNQVNLPPGFQLESDANLPAGFVLEGRYGPATSGSMPPPVSDPSDITVRGSGPSSEERLYDIVASSFRNDVGLGSAIGGTIGGAAGGAGAALLIGSIPPLTAVPEELVTVPLAMAGAAAGGAAGEAIEQKARIGSVVDWGSVARAGLWEGATEFGGAVAIGGAKRLFNALPIPIFKRPSAGVRSSIVPGERPAAQVARRQFQQTVKEFEKRGGVATPSQVDQRWWHHVYDALARGAYGGADSFAVRAEENAPILIEMAKDSVDDIVQGVSRESQTEVGEDLYRMFGRNLPGGQTASKIAAWRQLFDPVYDQVDRLSAGPVVNAQPLKQFAQQRLALDAGPEAGNILTTEGRSLLQKLTQLDDTVDLNTMRALRSRYGGMTRQFARDLNTDEAMVVRLQSLADDSIRNSATSPNLSPQARQLLLKANADYARYRSVMENVLPYRLTEQLSNNPQLVISKLFPPPRRGGEGAIRHITRVRDALTLTPDGVPDPVGTAMWDRLREAWATGIISKHAERGTLNTASLRAELRRYGQDSLDILLPAQQRNALDSVLNLTDTVTRGGRLGGGALVAKSAQAGGALMLYNGTKQGDYIQAGAGGMLLFGPMAYAKLATDPVGSRLLRAGIRPHKNEREAAAVATRIIRYLQVKDKQEQRASEALSRRYEQQFNSLLPQPKIQPPTMQQQRGFGGRGF